MVENYTNAKNPNDGTSPHYVTAQEMLAATQKNAAKRPNRFWARKLAERHLI